MKTSAVFKKIGEYTGASKNGRIYFYSEKVKNRMVIMHSQSDGSCNCIPVVREHDGTERVVFHAKTIKSLLEFLEGK